MAAASNPLPTVGPVCEEIQELEIFADQRKCWFFLEAAGGITECPSECEEEKNERGGEKQYIHSFMLNVMHVE